MKRFKLQRVIAGPCVKQVFGTVLSGATSGDISTELSGKLFVMGQQGNLLTQTVTADNVLYDINFFDRDYSVNNPDLYDNGYNLNCSGPEAEIIDTLQFGDYAFLMTDETLLGQQYEVSGQMIRNPHYLCVYNGQNESEITGYINDTVIDLSSEPYAVFGELSGGVLYLYCNNITDNMLYTISGGVPLAYMLEQPLGYNNKIPLAQTVYGDISGDITFVYTPLVSGGNLYSPYEDIEDEIKIYINPFKLKNIYDYNYQIQCDLSQKYMTGLRDYQRTGVTNSSIWLSYVYTKETTDILSEYEFVERIKGLIKFKPVDGHKSNVYSIRIKNSGLNTSIIDTTIRANIHSIIDSAIRNVVSRISPVHTQLWKIEWYGM